MTSAGPKYPNLKPWDVPLLTLEQHPDALTVIRRVGSSLQGKTAVVTGGSSGIGVETVRAFASAGVRVFVLVRQVEKTQQIMASIAREFPENGGLEVIMCELDSLESVNKAADEVIKRTKQLNILVNNAGVMNTPYQLTKDGFETQLGVNHVAHFLLFNKLLPLLLSSSTPEFNSRVVSVASSMHGWGQPDFEDLNFTNGRKYDGWAAYAQSKTCNIWFANEVEKQYGSKGVHAFSVQPGSIQSELHRNTSREMWIALGVWNEKGEYQMDLMWKTPGQGAATSIWAATSPDLEGKGGLYLEDISIAKPSNGSQTHGYAPFAYDEAAACKLWAWSEQSVKKYL